MTKDDITRMAREAGLRSAVLLHMYGKEDALCDSEIEELRQLERFAALVIKPWADQLEVERKRFQELNDVAALGMQHARAAERERIIAQNAPEIEKINAHIKTLEKALEDEREAIAQSLDKQAELAADEIDRQWAQEMAAAVRARGN